MARRRRRPWLRRALVVLGAAVLLALGIAIGEALHDNPRPATRTLVRTLEPAILPPAAPTTVTVHASGR